MSHAFTAILCQLQSRLQRENAVHLLRYTETMWNVCAKTARSKCSSTNFLLLLSAASHIYRCQTHRHSLEGIVVKHTEQQRCIQSGSCQCAELPGKVATDT